MTPPPGGHVGLRAAMLAIAWGVVANAQTGYPPPPPGGAYPPPPTSGSPPPQQPPPAGYPPGGSTGQPPPYSPPAQGGYPPGPSGQAPPYPPPQPGYGQYPPGTAAPGPYPGAGPPAPGYARVPVPPRNRSSTEIGMLYGTSVGYGIGLGIWIDAELGIEDPAAGLIAPAILGLAAPVGVYFLDGPPMARGMPAAIAAGMAIGAGEGLGIAGYQFAAADEANEWGFRGLTRTVAIGATLGGGAGWAIGYYLEPSPKLSGFVTSGAMWGTLIGSSVAYGVSEEGVGYGIANDDAALGGLIGFNAGLAVTGGLSMLFVPTWRQIGWMWGGAAIGGAASLPVFLFYAGDDAPPAKRGLVFTGTAIGLGIIAGGIFSSDGLPERGGRRSPDAADDGTGIAYVVPVPVEGGAGFRMGGTFQ